MSRTKHHRSQKHRHNGHDYGGRYKADKQYGCSYGVEGRDLADKERREAGNRIIREASTDE